MIMHLKLRSLFLAPVVLFLGYLLIASFDAMSKPYPKLVVVITILLLLFVLFLSYRKGKKIEKDAVNTDSEEDLPVEKYFLQDDE